MKKKFRVLAGAMMLAAAVGLTACEGDEGQIGPKGDKGDQGLPGKDAETESASFGNIEMTVSGTDYNGNSYSQLWDFKYLPYNDIYSSYWYEEDDYRAFYFGRERKISAPENGRTKDMGNTAYITVKQIDGQFVLDRFSFGTTLLANNTISYIYHSVYGDEDNAENFIISNASFNESTNKLQFDFSYSYVDYDDNDVTITGKVNVIVYYSRPS